ncbi:cupin domain-containing protein [Nitratireductor sp. ac15]
MPKVNLDDLPTYDGQDAAAAFIGGLGPCVGHAISKHHGLDNLGVNIETLMPGARSSHRHWHDKNDEVVVVLLGELVLLEEDGTTRLTAGDVAVFPAGAENGHCLENRTSSKAAFLVVGSKISGDRCFYADADLVLQPDGSLTRRDGSSLR